MRLGRIRIYNLLGKNTVFPHIRPAGINIWHSLQMRVLLENTTFSLHKIIRIAEIIWGRAYMRKYGRWGNTVQEYAARLLGTLEWVEDAKRSVNFEMTCWYHEFFQKTNEIIRPTVLWYLRLTCFCSFLGRIEDTKKSLRN